MARIQLPESRIRARRKKRIIRAIVAWVILLFLIWLIIVVATWLPQFRFNTVDIEGAQTIASSTLETAIEDELSGTYGYMFPRDNVLLYPKAAIARTLLAQFSPLKEVSVEMENVHTLRVAIEERAPVAVWCGEDIAATIPCTLLDEDGVAFAQSPDYSPGVYVRYFGPLATSTPPRFLPGQFETLTALIEVVQGKAGSDRIDSVAIDGNNDVRVTLFSGCQILFSLDQDGGTVVNDLDLAMKSDAFANHTLADFEYVDLRFGDKLYYKLKDSPAQ